MSLKALNIGEETTEVEDYDNKKVHGKTMKKEYVLNDLEALKKKLNNCKRVPEIEITGEATNGSSVTIAVKTPLFEYFKSSLVGIIETDKRITKIGTVRKVIADTNFNGEANVEYQLEACK